MDAINLIQGCGPPLGDPWVEAHRQDTRHAESQLLKLKNAQEIWNRLAWVWAKGWHCKMPCLAAKLSSVTSLTTSDPNRVHDRLRLNSTSTNCDPANLNSELSVHRPEAHSSMCEKASSASSSSLLFVNIIIITCFLGCRASQQVTFWSLHKRTANHQTWDISIRAKPVSWKFLFHEWARELNFSRRSGLCNRHPRVPPHSQDDGRAFRGRVAVYVNPRSLLSLDFWRLS
ncbi:uncharacterized protein CIMG_13074 [Coccidioides immitis RS]|uniref:Uncharacterized protein n=1 Tax=Coccidioides immitis (strain RS) TaxID=246410 RepID=A0A0D8JTG6_COCIM|nr:uncharacterized protein CIMG_13074 [Coccidioides immitis RS]KJF60610.1 hypothetical protein CIMG_13074 [Coccidioides immitis RS]